MESLPTAKGFTSNATKRLGIAGLPKDCGRFSSSSNKISGGFTAHRGQFPAYTHIQVLDQLGRRPESFCGGTILSEWHIITAAHCVHNRYSKRDNKLRLFPGANNFPDSDGFDIDPIEPAKVCRSRIFPVSLERPKFDLAIIKLARKIEFGRHIQPACLIDKNYSFKNEIFAVGLGSMELDAFGFSLKEPESLQALPVKMVACEKNDLDSTKVCFGSRNESHIGDTCSGDSGGGIFDLNLEENRSTLVALTSYGPLVCKRGQRGVSVNTKLVVLLEEVDSLLEECA